ncbi:MAG: DUF4430 domain-containing protein [Clostridioides sp.]|jgi:hypothetical protein|nr:DUF4430 domain-containing protein [Clostridioides sp.]
MRDIVKKKEKFFKKLIPLIFIVLVLISLVGCGIKTNISRTNDIPKDGIVRAETFKAIKEAKDMAMFDGDDGNIKYQWMFVGSDIDKPEDINLLIRENTSNIETVKKQLKSDVVQGISFAETKSIDSNPAVSITLDNKYDITGAEIYRMDSGDSKDSSDSSDNKDRKVSKAVKVANATVNTSNRTVVNFSIKDREGVFYIVGSQPKKDAIEVNKANTSDKGETGKSSNNQNKDKSLAEGKDSSKEGDSKAGVTQGQNGSSKGSNVNKDKYLTEPTPAGKPKPVEPGDSTVNKSKKMYATLSVRCDVLLKSENLKTVTDNGKGDMVPSNGVIYQSKRVEFSQGESVFDVLIREMKASNTQMEHVFTPMYNSAYIEGIHNLYEFDGGELSGWMYKVNGWFPNYGCSRYQLKENDSIEWVYTCDLGRDVGCDWLEGQQK